MRFHGIHYTTLLLSAVAGYCDTVTFVAGDTIFSAHVTGNFIVFAYQIIKGGDIQAWIKLITFPVFIIAVMCGGRLSEKSDEKRRLLLAEALLLLLAGVLAYVYPESNNKGLKYLYVMIVVFALGLQNAFGKLFPKDTYGPTTVMTGNVAQASLDIRELLINRTVAPVALISIKKQAITITGFLTGCVSGALCAAEFGLKAILAAALPMLLCYLGERRNIE
ncbi:YoaK family protein [Flavobacterium beibuense]|uniref:Permease transmembrane protein n=1 Tax=Flavobacterium beibuense TaxID=657326 RepID=A0A444WA79_9FLAO|nr:YoaK family protein [Flavobacterium beibuense]RYJ42797.1 Permease transmembrane protein [Flavobacterium beibuense]